MTSFTRSRPDGAIPALTAAYTDSFGRADSSLDATPDWVLRSGTAVIASNQVQSTSATLVAACTHDATAAHLVSLAASPQWMVCARLGPGGTDRYEFGYDFNRFKIRKIVSGALAASVQAPIAAAPTAPFTIELAIIDIPGRAFLSGRVNGTATVLMTDTSPLTGTLAGLSCSASGPVADDFGVFPL